MEIKVGFEISYAAVQPTPMVIMLSIHPSRFSDIVGIEQITAGPDVPIGFYRDSFGNVCGRLVAPAGGVTLRGDALVRDSGLPDAVVPTAQQLPIDQLPDDVLQYLMPSRYCETDKLTDVAWSLFGNTPQGWARVQAIVDFVHNHVTFGYQHAHHMKSAHDVYEQGTGVCRDFAHLALTFCRCMNIPARYCTGYLGDIGVPRDPAPMDFSGWFQVYLSGQWHTFDARHNAPRIGRILMGTGRDAADPRVIVPGVEGVPLAGEIDLKPAGEIHRRRIPGNADVAHVAGAIARRDVHATAERQRQMCKIAADAGALLVDVMRGFHVVGVLVAEGDVIVHEADDRLHAQPAGRRVAEQRPGDIGELVGLAIAARHQILQHFIRQLIDRKLLRGRHHHVRQAGIPHQRAAAQGDAAGGRHQASADIAEDIAIESDRHVGLGDNTLGADDVGEARRMDREHDHHRRRLHRRIGDLEADLDLHAQTFSACRSSPTDTTLIPTSMPTKASAEPR